MGVSVKVALLTCIAFTTGVCWLVNQVSRQPGGPVPKHATPTTLMSTMAPSTDQLQRQSPSETSRTLASHEPIETVRLDPAPIQTDRDVIPLPPIVAPEPEVARTSVLPSEPHDTPPPSAPVEVAETPQPRTGETDRPGSTTLTYKVAKGDSLSRICARNLGEDTPAIRRAVLALNPKIARRPNCLYAGETLELPILDPASAATSVAIGPPASSVKDGATAVGRAGGSSGAERSQPPKRPTDSSRSVAIGEKPVRKDAPKKPSGAASTVRESSKQGTGRKSSRPPAVAAGSAGTASPANGAKAPAKASKSSSAKSVASAGKDQKPAPAKAKSKETTPASTSLKAAKRTAERPAAEAKGKPATQRRGGTIDAR